MPIFEYRCLVCQNTFEQLVFTTQRSDIVCPRCQSNENERLFSTFAFSGTGGSSSHPGSSHSNCHSCSSKNCATCH